MCTGTTGSRVRDRNKRRRVEFVLYGRRGVQQVLYCDSGALVYGIYIKYIMYIYRNVRKR